MRPKNRKSKKCILCGKLFGLDKPWADVRDRKFCSRKCYYKNRGKRIVGKKYPFVCQKCGKKEYVSYKSHWIRNKHNQIFC